VEEYRQPKQQPSPSSLISSRRSYFYLWEHHHVANLLLVSFFCILSFSHELKHRCCRDSIELPLVQMEPRPTARSQSPYHVKSSGAQPAARSKSSPSICCPPEHTSGRTAAFYSCLMFARSSSSLLQVTNHTSQPS
jgi:hypothetical protein